MFFQTLICWPWTRQFWSFGLWRIVNSRSRRLAQLSFLSFWSSRRRFGIGGYQVRMTSSFWSSRRWFGIGGYQVRMRSSDVFQHFCGSITLIGTSFASQLAHNRVLCKSQAAIVIVQIQRWFPWRWCDFWVLSYVDRVRFLLRVFLDSFILHFAQNFLTLDDFPGQNL